MAYDNITWLTTIELRGLVTADQFTVFLEYYWVVNAIIDFLGLIGNVINIKTFISMGLEDGVSVSFLALSFSDFFYLLAMVPRAVSGGFMVLEMKSHYKTWFPVEPYGVYIYFFNVCIMLYVNTVLITTFLAVARCMCVAKPLHFKNAFTRRRCVYILVAFSLFTVFGYIPIMYFMGMVKRYDARIKTVRPHLWISPSRELAKDIVWGVRDTFLAFSTQFIVVVCVFIMAKCLRKSSAFRESSMSMVSERSVKTEGGSQNNNKRMDIKSSFREEGDLHSITHDGRGSSGKLSGKDLQVVIQVILISVVYIVCNMPKIMITAAGFIEEDLTLNKRYQNIYLMMLHVADIFQMVNSSINVFIYYHFNSKFRRSFKC